MKPDSAIGSALAAAAVRAIESYHPKEKRLFEDCFARRFLPPVWRGIIELLRLPGLGTAVLAMRERQFPGAMGNVFCRTRFIDDALQDALREGIEQVVILGAGYDSRAYRIRGIEQASVFEVDHPAPQARKKARLQQLFRTIPSHVTFVPIDFDRQALEDAMAATTFRTDTQTFFIWEGVTQYITAEAVDATFRCVSCTAATGSKIVFTYIHRGIIDGSTRSDLDQKIVSAVQRFGMPWVFGLDPTEVSQYLAVRGLKLIEDVGASDHKAHYLDPIGRKMNVFEGERIALAYTA